MWQIPYDYDKFRLKLLPWSAWKHRQSSLQAGNGFAAALWIPSWALCSRLARVVVVKESGRSLQVLRCWLQEQGIGGTQHENRSRVVRTKKPALQVSRYFVTLTGQTVCEEKRSVWRNNPKTSVQRDSDSVRKKSFRENVWSTARGESLLAKIAQRQQHGWEKGRGSSNRFEKKLALLLFIYPLLSIFCMR